MRKIGRREMTFVFCISWSGLEEGGEEVNGKWPIARPVYRSIYIYKDFLRLYYLVQMMTGKI
jgi:hypothetical protein